MFFTTTSPKSFRRASLVLLAVSAGPAQETTFRTTVPLVITPVSVTDPSGRPIDGLTTASFVLLDNGQRRKIESDIPIHPIALVLAVQSSANAAAALTKVRRIGSMIEPLITGRRGRCVVVAFDHEVRTLQTFTGDPNLISRAVASIEPRTAASRMIDAIAESVRLLRDGPPNHRRVILLISEARDRSSKISLAEALTLAQRDNVSIYTVTYSPFLSAWAVKQHEVPPPRGMDLTAIFRELHQSSKQNAAESFARYTGGRHLAFLKLKGLEDTINAIGEELHSQYLLSFAPPAESKAEYHAIEVFVPGRPDAVIRARPGYWMSPP